MRGAWRVFELSLGEMLWSRRTVFLALVVGCPVLVALVIRIVDKSPFENQTSPTNQQSKIDHSTM